MFDCTINRYDEIYAPWLREAGVLLGLVRYAPGMKLLDLCGGTGSVSHAAIYRRRNDTDPARLADVTLLDLNPRCKIPQVKQVKGRAEDVAVYFPKETFDIVVCRQAIGYLNLSPVFAGVARVLKPGGWFVFNSFIHPLWGRVKPYSWKTYKFEGSHYIEAHYFAFNHIAHLQWRFGTGWDVTLFKYHDSEKISQLLVHWFNFSLQEQGRGHRWVCFKRPPVEVEK